MEGNRYLDFLAAYSAVNFGHRHPLIIAAARHGRLGPGTVLPVIRGIVANPMIVSMLAGLAWSALRLPMPAPAAEFLSLLGAAATPGALFAIGASLAHRPAQCGPGRDETAARPTPAAAACGRRSLAESAQRGAGGTVIYAPPKIVYDRYGNVALAPTAPSSGAGRRTGPRWRRPERRAGRSRGSR